MLEDRLEQDIKSALLAHDTQRVTTLRGLKAVLLNVKVAENKRDTGLGDNEVIAILAKEAKKRQESADLYIQGGDKTRSNNELEEKAIIEEYLPEQLSDADIEKTVEQVITETQASSPADLGKVIGQVKAKLGAAADGATIARLVKEKLS